ncbi:hypothetical protein Q4488_13470 [Amphritea sp. 1_MG-2023]|uniref:hypothetical protein n=1 Tax=Amphritea sp. 1_MG-2023 TaxID=3062670 RepID=UPI0026E12149|nr:hypothetical protein [Amphritea sp. 1_MG-2023]MDO6564394.1 hypothetical protein [Amphritea sp. 1_MG-2023]
MLRKLLSLLLILVTLAGCAAYEYGYSSPDYEGKLVSLESDWGQKRLNQIVNFDNSAMSLIALGYSPTYLYEVTDDDYYFIGALGSYHLKREFMETDSTVTKITVIPSFIQYQMDKFGIQLSLPKKQMAPESGASEIAEDHVSAEVSDSLKVSVVAKKSHRQRIGQVQVNLKIQAQNFVQETVKLT